MTLDLNPFDIIDGYDIHVNHCSFNRVVLILESLRIERNIASLIYLWP